MLLFDLPNELLYHIGQVVRDEVDLNALTRTHSRLHALLEPALYRLGYQRRPLPGSRHVLRSSRRRPPPSDKGSPRRAPETTVLHWAAENDRTVTAEKALRWGADVNALDDSGRTALWIAADKGHVDIIQLLLGVDGVDVDVETEFGYSRWNCLFQACWKNRDGAIDVLLQSGRFDPNAPCSTGWRPLEKSVLDGRLRSVRALVASGQVDVNRRGIQSTSPFAIACARGRDAMGVLFIEAGLDAATITGAGPDGTTDLLARTLSGGQTALHMASTGRMMETLARLLAIEGIDVNARDDNGRTPLHTVAYSPVGERARAAEMLLAMPSIDREARAADGRTPLELAVAVKNHEVAKVLGYVGKKRQRRRRTA